MSVSLRTCLNRLATVLWLCAAQVVVVSAQPTDDPPADTAQPEGKTASANRDWEASTSTNGVQLYLRDYPDSGLPEFKGVTVLDASMASVIAVLLDVQAYDEWVHQCERAFVLASINPREQYIYQVNKIPWARDRDIILRAELSYRDNGRNIRIAVSATPDFCQTHDIANCERIDTGRFVRVEQSKGSYYLEQLAANRVRVTWQQHIDPGGRIPAWLARPQIKELPLKTLANLAKQVQKPRYQNKEIQFTNGTLVVVDKTVSSR